MKMMNFVNALNALRITVWVAIGLFLLLRIGSRWISRRANEDSLLMAAVNAANALKSNIWAIVIIAAGVLLTCCGDKEDGRMLISGGMALYQHQPIVAEASGAPAPSTPQAAIPAPVAATPMVFPPNAVAEAPPSSAAAPSVQTA